MIGVDSDVLKEIEINDLTDICKEFEISTSQKVKLKAVIRKLQTQPAAQSPSNLPPVLFSCFVDAYFESVDWLKCGMFR